MKTDDISKAVVIGRVGSPAGLKGEFRINLYAGASSNLKEGKNLLFRHVRMPGASAVPAEFEAACERVRYQNDKPVVKVHSIDDRNAAESIRGMEVSIYEDELDKLPEGEHYVRNLIGCRVVDLAGGSSNEIGMLKDVIQNTAQSVLDVETKDGRSVLIPAVDAFMRNIDEDAGLIEVELIPGFLD